MATFKYDKDLLLTCPYNPDHRVAPRRFDIHLIKCAKTSTLKLEICPFHAAHRIPKELMAAHVVECEFASSDILEMVQREKTEWEKLEDKKEVDTKTSGAAELAERMGAIGLDTHKPPQNVQPVPDIRDDGWDYNYTYPKWTIPGLEDSKKKDLQTAYGGNAFRYQLMTPSEKRAFNEKLVQKARERQGKLGAKEAAAKEKEMREKREKEKKEEEERLEAERKEQERVKKEKEAKKKAKKEKIKAAKRAAFLAGRTEEKHDQVSESDDE